MDFNVKKLVKDAGTAFNRVVQLTEEKLGTSEKTELDAHFEHLAERSEATRIWTEKIVSNVEAVLTPNLGARLEDFVLDKIEKKKPNRLSNLEYLGSDMIDAGNDFGPGTAYGSTLIKVGQYEQRLGRAEREFISTAHHSIVSPLRKFLDTEMKTIQKERALLESRRLDLDACKSRLRKARSIQNTQAAECDLLVAQNEFDRQAEITKLLLEGVNSSHASHLRCLQEFVESQVHYQSQCNSIMQELQNELSSQSHANPSVAALPSLESPPDPLDQLPRLKARVLYDYDAQDASELSLLVDEVITVREVPGMDSDYLLGERGTQKGKVPKAFLEVISH